MRNLLWLPLALCLLLAAPVKAAESPAVPAARIGVVDMQTVATQSDPAKAAKEQMEAKFGQERSKLEKSGESLKKQAEALKNPKVSDQKKLDFIKAKQELDQKTRNFLRKVEQEELKLRQEMITLVFNATYEVARAKGYNFVVDVTAGGVLYADQSMDLTQDVLAEVNKLYKTNSAKKPEPAKDDKTPAKGGKK